MSKQGRARRTPAKRLEARENRSSLGYLQNLQRKAREETLQKMVSETSPTMAPTNPVTL